MTYEEFLQERERRIKSKDDAQTQRFVNAYQRNSQSSNTHNNILSKIEMGKSFYNNAMAANDNLHYSSKFKSSPFSELGIPSPTDNPFVEKIGDGWTEDQKNNYFYLLAEDKDQAKQYARTVNAYGKTSPVLANPISQGQAQMEIIAKEIDDLERKKKAEKKEVYHSSLWGENYGSKSGFKSAEDYDAKINQLKADYDLLKKGEATNLAKYNIKNYGSEEYKQTANLGYDKFLKDELEVQKTKDIPLWQKAIINNFDTASDTPIGTAVKSVEKGYREDRSYMLPNENWTQEQKDIFGFYYNSNKQKAFSYAMDVNDAINLNKQQEQQAELSTKVTKNFWSETGNSLLSVPANVIGGAAEYLDNIVEGSVRGRITNKSTLSPQEYAMTVRQAVSENHEWNVGGYDVFDLLYNTAMSGADSIFASVTMRGGAGVMLGASAAANTIDDIKARGGNAAQAIIGGTVSGIFEGLFEQLSLGQLDSMKGTTAKLFAEMFSDGQKGLKVYAKQLAKDIAKSMVTNASEEFTTEIANILYDTLANGSISNYAQLVREYMNNGESEASARVKASGKLALQALEAGVSGALMGVFFGAVGTTSAYGTANKAYTGNVGANYRDITTELIESGLESPEGTESRNLAEQYKRKVDSGKSLTNNEITKLVAANQQQIKAEQQNTGVTSQTALLSSVPTDTISFALQNAKGNITFETLGITDTNTQQQLIDSGVADVNGNINRNVLSTELESRNANADFNNPLRTAQSVLDSIDTGGVNIPSANTTNVDSDVYEQYNDNIEKDNGGNINGSQNTDLLAGRKVSAANRSGNSIREQSENTRALSNRLERFSPQQRNIRKRIQAGNSGWLVRRGQEEKIRSRFKEGLYRELSGIKLNPFDSAGRILSKELQKKLSNTVLKTENGTIISVFHWTQNKFDEFKYGDIGYHGGTLQSTFDRQDDNSEIGKPHFFKEMYYNITNPLYFESDGGVWDAESVASRALDIGVITDQEYSQLEHLKGFNYGKYDDAASVELRRILKEKGYDGIIYVNEHEDKGNLSVIVFDADQIITVAENGVLKEGVGVTEKSDDDIDNSGTGSGFKEPGLNLSNKEKVDMAFGKTTNSPEYSDVIKLGEDLGLKAKDISFTVKFGLTRGNAVSKVVKAAFKNNAQYSQYFSSFEKVISESDMYKNWAETSNKKNTTVLDFAIEICFGNNKSAQKQLADIISNDKNASKFIPTMLSDIYSKVGNRYGIESALKDLSYTFTEAAYDARHSESDDVFADKYAKDESFWTAKNKNKPHKETANLKDKILSLFGKTSNNEKIPSISEIVKLIEESFKVPISKGKFREKAFGIYKNKSEAIRTKVENALPTIAHELGHHLDKKHKLSSLPSIDEAVKVLKTERPDFFNSYSPKKHPHEAVAEFVRFYLADRTQAKAMYPNFFGEFEATIRKNSIDDFNNIRTIGDKINGYFTADKAERAKTTVLTRAEAKKLNRRSVKLADILEDAEIRVLDDAAALKKVSEKAYDLYYFAKKSSVRAKNTISGYYMSGFDGNLVEMRDKNGNIIKDENGKPKYVPSLAYILDGVNDEQTQHDFDEYLVAKHGIYWIKNDLRVYADDTHNNVEFMQSQIEKFEKQYPKFKETAENLYSWYRTFIYEYGIKSGLLSKEQYTNMTTKYPCYVPFMRNVEANKRGIKASLANQNAPIQRASGSGLDILSPIENIVIKVEQFMKAADRNAVMQEVADIADTAEGKGFLLEKVPPNLIPVTVAVKAEEGDLIDNAIIDTITEFKVANNQGENVVWVYRNGEKTYYQVHDVNLLSALTAMNKTQYNLVTKVAGNITRAFKALTTGGNAVWSLASNAPRDFSSAYKYSSENNPIKFTIDYIKAFKSAFSESYLGDKAADEVIKLYKSVGGGFNNSLSNSGRELKLTIKEIFQKDKGIIKRITTDFNFIEMIEKLADSVETAPRLAEFKRVYEKTGDTKAALKAAEEITVNFNRSGIHGKVIDQYIPYFNASLQGNRKLASTLSNSLKKGGDKSFLVKTVVCGLVKVGLIFAINNLIMGDDDNDEYEKLSAYKKNNFYNIYIGDGKFISIPKAKDTAVFDSFLERTFEIAMKEDVELSKEIEDFCAYIWLIFGPPLLDDTIGFSTALDLASNEDFTGAPIVPSNLEDLKPEMQYNENTTYIAKSLGKLFGYSPIKIDHIIDSNLGWFGLLNRSLGKEEKDWSLGVKTKIVTDNVYSSDSLNNFYDKAEHYASQTKSYPDDTDAAYNNKRYSSIRSIISEINQYGKEDETAARDYRILAKNYADNYINEIAASEKLLDLFKKSQNTDILPYKSFSAEYSIDKVKYKMDSDDFMNYIEEYYSEIEEEYDDILKKGYSDETTIGMLIDAKKDVDKRVSKKYKVKQ